MQLSSKVRCRRSVRRRGHADEWKRGFLQQGTYDSRAAAGRSKSKGMSENNCAGRGVERAAISAKRRFSNFGPGIFGGDAYALLSTSLVGIQICPQNLNRALGQCGSVASRNQSGIAKGF